LVSFFSFIPTKTDSSSSPLSTLYYSDVQYCELEFDRCIGMPIYIGRYDDVSYQQNFADIYRHNLLIKADTTRCYVIVLHGMFGNPRCHFVSDWSTQILWPVPQIFCKRPTVPRLHQVCV